MSTDNAPEHLMFLLRESSLSGAGRDDALREGHTRNYLIIASGPHRTLVPGLVAMSGIIAGPARKRFLDFARNDGKGSAFAAERPQQNIPGRALVTASVRT